MDQTDEGNGARTGGSGSSGSRPPPTLDGLTAEEVVDWACSDQVLRWRRGEKIPCESYFRLHPALSCGGQGVIDLIYAEFALRADLGESPTLEEFVRRFPAHAETLRDQVLLDQAMDDDDPEFPLDSPPNGDDPPPTAQGRWPAIEGYEIEEELGRGGMGVVYKARQLALNRTVALKMILAGGHAGPEATARFLAEAEAVAKLQHPHVVQIYSVGQAGGLPYLVLEYLPGGNLARTPAGLPRPPREAAKLVEPLAQAIAEAHRLGVVHRDLKPANVLLAADGTPKVADFGLAKALDGPSGITHTEAILGSPSYMAPEQAAGLSRGVGAAADVYSLGAILYEVLTGRPPFKAATPLETLQLVRTTEPVPPSRLQPNLPRDLETIALTCLHKEPGRRYAGAAALAEDLRRYLAGEAILARPSTAVERAWRWCRRNPVVAMLVASVATLLVVLSAGSTVAALWLRQERDAIRGEQLRAERSERGRRVGLVEALLTAAPEGVPYILATLRTSRDLAVPLLRRHVDAAGATPERKLRAAEALATLQGDPKTSFLVESIPTAPASECLVLATALEAFKGLAVPALEDRARVETDPAVSARFAAVLLHLGAPGAAREALASRGDPSRRVAFVNNFAAWHGGLGGVPPLLRSDPEPTFRSGLATALGTLDPSRLSPDDRGALVSALLDLHRDDPDGATHSAAGWALRRWGVTPPPVPATAGPADGRRWFVNAKGLTMIGLPAAPNPAMKGRGAGGKFVPLRPLYMSDCEIRADLFRAFADDPGYPASKKPAGWTGPDRKISPTDDCPVNNVSWVDALLFCNWLSVQEGRTPCYEPVGAAARAGADDWRCDTGADGYRLPVELEWEYACRAGTTTLFPFGDEPDLLARYGNATKMRAYPGGGSFPNDWGLFDTLGNCWEWCWDARDGAAAPAAAADAVLTARGKTRAARGGAYGSGPYYCLSDFFFRFDANARGKGYGFRVVCGTARPDPTGALRVARSEAWARTNLSRADGRAEAARVLTATARWHLSRSEPEQAAADFAEIIASAPADWSPAAARVDPDAGRGAGPTPDAEMMAWEKGFARAVALNPADQRPRLAWVRFYAELGLWDLASARCAETATIAPLPVSYWNQAAYFAVAAGDLAGYHRHCARFAAALGRSPTPQTVLTVAEACSVAPGGHADPSRLADLAESTLPAFPNLYFPVGLALYRDGRDGQAAERFRSALAVSPGLHSAEAALALVSDRLGQDDEASRLLGDVNLWWEGVVQVAWNDPNGVSPFPRYQDWARAFVMIDEARRTIAGPSLRDDPKFRLVQGRARARLGHWESAAADLAAALSAFPDEPGYRRPRAAADAVAVRRDPLFERLVALRPGDTQLWVARSRELARRGLWDEASAAYARVDSSRGPTDDRLECACLLLLTGDVDGYRRQVRLLAATAGNRPGFFSTAAQAGLLVPGGLIGLPGLDGGVDRAQAGVRPTSRRSAHWLGLALHRRGRHREALAHFLPSRADSDPDPVVPTDLLGLCLAHDRLGDIETALRLLAEAETRLAEAPADAVDPAEWLEAQVLLREARDQIRSRSLELPADVFARP